MAFFSRKVFADLHLGFSFTAVSWLSRQLADIITSSSYYSRQLNPQPTAFA